MRCVSARATRRSIASARALIQLDRLDEAESRLRAVLAANAEDVQAHGILARLRQLRGDADPLHEFRAAARRADASPALRLAFGDAMLRRGELEAAETELRELLVHLGPLPALRSSLATILMEQNRADEAFAQVRDILDLASTDAALAESCVVVAIANGALESALRVIERMRAARPRDQRWITHRIDVARLRAETAFESWFDPKLVTRVYDLPVKAAGLARVLAARHRQGNHPLDQSLRHGTQTSRNLLVRPEPQIAALLELFIEATNEYLSEVGATLASAAGHPLTARSSARAALVGCWSVRLRSGGFHVNHIHPEGWVSSAFYLSVPEECADPARRAGWLKFGEPRHAVAGLEPTGFVPPLPGRLVLFPSYLWHGTTPLSGDQPRLTVAFDAVPANERL